MKCHFAPPHSQPVRGGKGSPLLKVAQSLLGEFDLWQLCSVGRFPTRLPLRIWGTPGLRGKARGLKALNETVTASGHLWYNKSCSS